MSKSLGTVAISWNRRVMEMVHFRKLVTILVFRENINIQNGPPEVGKLEKETENLTPIPFGLAVAEIEPLILPRGSSGLKNDFEGRVAT